MPALVRRALLALALLGLLTAPAPARAEWILGVDGSCRYQRSLRNVTRGPVAMLHGAVYPVRSVLGGLFFSATACLPELRCLPTIPFWLAGSVIWGVGRGAWWLGTGALDTVSLGLAPLNQEPFASTEAAQLRLHPVLPMVDHGDPGDRCDRARSADPGASGRRRGRKP